MKRKLNTDNMVGKIVTTLTETVFEHIYGYISM